MMRLTQYSSQGIHIFTFSISLPSILIDGGISIPWLRTLVLLRLMVRSKTDSVVSVYPEQQQVLLKTYKYTIELFFSCLRRLSKLKM